MGHLLLLHQLAGPGGMGTWYECGNSDQSQGMMDEAGVMVLEMLMNNQTTEGRALAAGGTPDF